MVGVTPAVAYPDFPIAYILAALSLLTVILNLPVAIWHYQHRNVAAFSLVFWLLLTNSFQVANSLIWPNDDYDHWWHGKGFCDAQIYLYWGSVIGMAGAVACIMRGLAKVMDTKNTIVAPTKGDRRKAMVHDAVFCFGLPGLIMFALYVVQTRRYDVQGLNGCIAEVDDSWVAIFLLEIWPLVVSLLGGYYAGECCRILFLVAVSVVLTHDCSACHHPLVSLSQRVQPFARRTQPDKIPLHPPLPHQHNLHHRSHPHSGVPPRL